MADKPIYENNVATAGIHALVVGISEYSHLPGLQDPPEEESWNFTKLTSAALSAYKVYAWLDAHKNDLRLPIKSIRLLLAPSEAEKRAEPQLGNVVTPFPTWEAFKDAAWGWREAAGNDPQDMTLFYFAGHGLQRGPEEGILLFADFAQPQTAKLSRCVSFSDIRTGMAPTAKIPNIAQTQFYFVDACRVRPSELNTLINPKPAEIWELLMPKADKREAPILFSTVDNAIAIGRDGEPSYFAEGLLLAFDRAAEDPDDSNGAVPVWPITSVTLKTALDNFYLKQKVGTKIVPGGMVGAPVLRYLPTPPDVDVEIFVRPDLLTGKGVVKVCDDDDVTVDQIAPLPQMPVTRTIKAGIYRLVVDSPLLRDSPYRSKSKSLNQRTANWPHDLTSRMPAG